MYRNLVNEIADMALAICGPLSSDPRSGTSTDLYVKPNLTQQNVTWTLQNTRGIET